MITRPRHTDLSDFKAMARYVWYTHWIIQDDPHVQRRGVVLLADARDTWRFSSLQSLHFMAVYPSDKPYHLASVHVLYNDPTVDAMIRRVRYVLPNDYRMRIRSHFGSVMEIQYSLKTFGIDVSGQLSVEKDSSMLVHYDGIEESIRKRQQFDDQWQKSEATYRDPGSRVALFPNPQDVIISRN